MQLSTEPEQNGAHMHSVLRDNPGAIVGFIVGVTGLILIVAATTYTLVRRRRGICRMLSGTSNANAFRTVGPGGDQLLDEPHSFTLSWSGSSGNGDGAGSSRHLASPMITNSMQPPQIGTGLGKVQFTVTYDTTAEELQVLLLRCMELCKPDSTLNTVDSFVKMELLPEKRHRVKTRVVRGTGNPFFGEAFTLGRVSPSQLNSASLHFIVVGFDRFSRESVIGEVLCRLDDLKLNLSREVTITKEILKRQFAPVDRNRGSLLVSLCYLPAASRITVVVLKAEGLPKVDLADSSGNPYVKLYFLESDRRIAKKKTHVKKRTSDPVFNEAFALEIPPHAKLENVKLDFRVVNWQRDSPSKIIGHVVIGCQGNEVAREQWKTAIEKPRQQVAEWHRIYS